MIRHFVLLSFRDDVSAATKAALYDELAALAGHLPGMTGFHAGPNVSVETDLVRGNHDAFWVDFADVAARDAYLADEKHWEIGARLTGLTVDGLDGITVVDMEV
ncbi:MAG: Dabb family protein [Phyllobacteriaceae bacterium]|nr:Dabb family protein [Phyllobacteriaceae bacterium]